MNKWQLRAQEYIGQIYGRLTVIEILKPRNQRTVVKCKCACGNTHISLMKPIKKGDTKSCGCYRIESRHTATVTHGDTKYKLYRVWRTMIRRCHDERVKSYKTYGKRGISVCQKWRDSYPIFKKWAIKKGYKFGLQIDRINNNGNYEPINCRWVTSKVNNNNTRNNTIMEFKGIKKPMNQWAEEMGINKATLSTRYNQLKWSVEKCLTEPIKNK